MQRTAPPVPLTCLALLSACLWLAAGCAGNPNPLQTTSTTQTSSTQGTTPPCTSCRPAISLAPSSAGLKPGASLTFSATAYYVSDSGVAWTIKEGTTGGTITDTGVYTAPLTEGVYHVTATSKANSALTQTATIAVTATEFTLTGSMSTVRYGFTASLLPNGQVFVAGGENDDYNLADQADLYDPATRTFHPAGQVSRDRHSATVLANGDVLLAGGLWATGQEATVADLRKAESGAIQPTGSMNTSRYGHTATLLQDGRVLIAGGTNYDGGTTKTTKTAELYDPASGKFTSAGDMTMPRTDHSAALLSNGKVLIIGGYAYGSGDDSGAELYDPATNSFAPAPGVATSRCWALATPLADGRVLIAGGEDCSNTAADTAEIYDPLTGQSSPTGKLVVAQSFASSTLLPDGRVLLVSGSVPNLSQLYDPATGTFSFGPHLVSQSGYPAYTTLLSDGSVLAVVSGSPYAELYK